MPRAFAPQATPGPLANRVAPDGSLFATAARGSLLGNRGGRFHDPATQTVRGKAWATKQWICCALSFKNRRRAVWGRYYTELFFSDEIAALAAGHRPCFECRRADAAAFAEAVRRHEGLARPPRAPEMDARLHEERLDGRRKRLHCRHFSDLPDGAMILFDDAPHALEERRLWRWSFTGYARSERRMPGGLVDVLTPPLILGALQCGYRPLSR